MSIEIFIARHGQTQWNKQYRLQGQHDSPLTSVGVEQSNYLGQQLKQLAPTSIYSSDLGRAVQTATIANQHLNLPLQTHISLRERHFGLLQGKSIKVNSKFYPTYQQRLSKPNKSVAGMETELHVRQRIQEFVQQLSQLNENRVAVICHGEWMRILCESLKQQTSTSDTSTLLTTVPDNGQVLHLSYQGGNIVHH
ncbi:histidine phosphatase family protein [Shewanella sp. TC10]|uniref:histidine phosphatase family protein n=1 Tax=Shewanella sp. TC10 TaxID=1419739 RepID=UPI00129D3A53|nr:histidine phosphatase family protein [Shewanella sp. TC10]